MSFVFPTNRLIARCAAVCGALVMLMGIAYAQTGAAPPGSTVVFGDITVRVDAAGYIDSQRGYRETRVRLTNRSGDRIHRVRLDLPNSAISPGAGAIRLMTRTVDIGPGASMVAPLWEPPLRFFGDRLQVTIDGQPQAEGVRYEMAYRSGSTGLNDPADVLISQRAAAIVKERASMNQPSGPKVSWYESEQPMTDGSTSWLGYSRYQGIVITADEMRSLSVEVREAILSSVDAGGTLMVAGKYDGPWPQQIPRAEYPHITILYPGFGAVIVCNVADITLVEPTEWAAIHDEWQRERMIGSGDPESAVYYPNKSFPVIDSLSVPVRGLLVLMFLFVLVIGPINLLWLAKLQRRIWMLWTIPAISLITCLAVAAWALVSEGMSRRVRTEVLTMLDEQNHRAVTAGRTAFYSPLTPGDGLHFSYDTEISPDYSRQWRFVRGITGSARAVDWSQDQHLSQGWITARNPAHFFVRKVETRRERLSVATASDGTITVVNGLGATIKSLWLADARAKLYSAPAQIPAGGRATLIAHPEMQLTCKCDSRQSWYASSYSQPSQQLMPGQYLAEIDGSPFLEDGLRNARIRQLKTTVIGILAANSEGRAQ